jgi:hypothetical protein
MLFSSLLHRTHPSRWPFACACSGAFAGIALMGCLGPDPSPTAFDDSQTAAGGNLASASHGTTPPALAAAHAVAARNAAALVASGTAAWNGPNPIALNTTQSAGLVSTTVFDQPEQGWAGYTTILADVNRDGRADLVWNSLGAVNRRMSTCPTATARSGAL